MQVCFITRGRHLTVANAEKYKSLRVQRPFALQCLIRLSGTFFKHRLRNE